MRQDAKAERHAQIEAAAYRVLEEKGYAGTSMLAIARAAKASNETLYNWYGDKTGLFKALVARNAEEIRRSLTEALAHGDDPLETLGSVGPRLLQMLTGPRAVALNRAAAADPTGVLGAALAEGGRNTIGPLIGAVLGQAQKAGQVAADDPDALLELYLGLLIGDLQIRCVVGRADPITPEASKARSDRALHYLTRLSKPGG